MYKTISEPRVADDGVTFSVEVGFTDRECIVSKNALARLGRATSSDQLDYLSTYRAFEDRIHSVARRMVVAGASGTPLVLGASCFA